MNTKISFIPKIIYEDKDFLIVNKPPGMVVHHDLHHHHDTLWDFVKNKLQFENNIKKTGIVHRLDKPTSGLLVIARNLSTWLFFKKKMQKRKIKRKYFALVQGIVKEKKFTVDVSLTKPGKYKRVHTKPTGAKAITHFQIIQIFAKRKQTLLECELETGRTHQIRGHLKFLNFPIINDPLYQGGKNNYIYLHAYYLSLPHPLTKKEMEFKIDLPLYFQKKLS